MDHFYWNKGLHTEGDYGFVDDNLELSDKSPCPSAPPKLLLP